MLLRELLGAARDQGERATCLSIATSDGHHGARSVGPQLASDFLHHSAATILGTGINEAVSASSVMAALLDDGQPAESECPYSPSLRDSGWMPPVPRATIWRHRTALARTTLWHTISTSLSSNAPVVLLMEIDDAFWDPVAGVIETPAGMPRASHAVLAVGLSTAPDRVLVRNSWGAEWGDAGYGWLSSAYIAARCTALITFGGPA